MEKSIMKTGLIALVTALALAACTKETSIDSVLGSQIMFSASTEWLNGPLTRTEYSGKDENNADVGSSSAYERIDWEPGYDRIRILCEAADKGPTADYDLTGSTTVVAQKSQAKLKPTNKNGLEWGSETKAHYFYAYFPASGMTSKLGNTVADTDATIAAATGNKATVTGVIPAAQTVVQDGNVFKPDMNHAYMYATAKVDAGGASTVGLSFYPLVTAFEFTLLTPAGDPVSSNLKTVKLSSKNTPLTGSFSATLSADAAPVISTVGTTGKEITVTLPGTGVALSSSQAVKVTILALPVKQTELTLDLIFANGAKRSLDLKKAGQWVEVAACKKLYLQNVGVPGSIYYLDVTGPTATIAQEGGSATYTVKSYRSATGENVGVGWTTRFSTDNGATWSSTKPSWLTEFTTTDANGSVTAKSYTATTNANTDTTPNEWRGGTTVGSNNSKANALNLSLYDVKGNRLPNANNNPDVAESANCYVVSKPGWYKIPCVYGNSMKNGGWNRSAFQNSNTEAYSLNTFIRHDDRPITDPWIVQNVGADNKKFVISGATLLWQDVQNLVTDVQYDPNFIYFQVPASNIKQGNAVVGAIVNGAIAWSWHIWVMDTGSLTTTQVYSHADNPSVENPVEVLDVNLGWYDAATLNVPRTVQVRVTQNDSGQWEDFFITQVSDHSFGGCVYYQWGRKDPMLGFDEYFEEKPQYYPNEAHKFKTGAGLTSYGGTTGPTLGTSIQNPNVFYTGYYWSRTRYDNLWNANAKYNRDVKVVKTVYDPCPVGFKVPNMKAFTGFGKTSNTTTYNDEPNILGHFQSGWVFKASPTDTKGIFFPATTLREHSSGVVRYHVATLGEYYMATKADHFTDHTNVKWSPYYLEFDRGSVRALWHNGTTCYGFAVRPIADK